MSKLDDYKRLLNHIRDSNKEGHTGDLFPDGFGQFTELLLSDDITTWPPSNQPYFDVVRQIKKEFITSNSLNQFESLKNSLLTSFYTPTPLCQTIVKSLPIDNTEALSILEPSAGTGNFVGPLKDTFPNASITAIEKDTTAYSILSSSHDIQAVNTPFEQFESNKQYDLIVSNIPFGNFKVYNKGFSNSQVQAEKRSLQKIHNFFFIRSLDFLQDNGLIALIAPSGFADSPANELFREHLAKQANLVFFNRLPIQTFKGSGTSASSDLIVFQKDSRKKKLLTYENQFVKSHKRQQVNINGLLVKHPRLGIGTPELGGQYGNKTLQFSFRGTPEALTAQLAKRLDLAWDKQRIQRIARPTAKDLRSTSKPGIDKAASKKDKGQYYLDLPPYYEDGNLAIHDNRLVKVNKVYPNDSFFSYRIIDHHPFYQAQQIIEIRDLYKRLVIAETTDKEDPEPIRSELDKKYSDYTSFFGDLHNPANSEIIDEDSEAHKIFALEYRQGGKYIKADIFTKRIHGTERKTKIESLSDAIAHSLNKSNKVDIQWISEQLGRKQEEVINEAIESQLLFYNPVAKGTFELSTKDHFLSGDVVGKKIALTTEKQSSFPPLLKKHLQLHQELMEGIQPAKLPLELLYIKLGERWIDKEIYEEFAKRLFNTPVSINYLKSQDKFVVEIHGYSADAFNKYSCSAGGRGMYYGQQLLEFAMVDHQPTITKTITGKDKEERKVVDEAKMKYFEMKTDLIKREFEAFISSDEVTRKYIEEKYHRLFNNKVLREYDGSHQQLDDLQHFIPHQHQKNATWKLLQEGGGILDHKVGYGKTLTMVMTAMEMRRLGIAKKPCIIGLKANTMDIYDTFKLSYPNAKVLYPSEKDFTPNKRKQFFEKIMNNDWDCIIMTHDQFLKIPQSQKIEREIIEQELRNLRQDLLVLQGDDSFGKRLLKGLEKRKANMEAKLEELTGSINRDANVNDFDTMGIDHLFVDESQQFKNLQYSTRHQRVSGLGPSGGSKRALNLLTAVRTLQAKHGGDKGVTFSSGTPISNSLVELYLLFKYLRPKELERKNIQSFDAWASIYAVRSSDYEFSVTGEIKKKDRFRQFVKVPELAKFYRETADVVNEKNFPLNEPKLNNTIVEIEPTPEQLEYNKELVDFAKSKGSAPLRDIMLSEYQQGAYMLIATNQSKKMSLDMQLVDPGSYDVSSSAKLSQMCRNVKSEYDQSSGFKGVQVIFCDMGTPNPKGNYNVYDTIRKLLVEEHMIPEDEISFVHDYASEKNRNKLFQMLRDGEKRIIIGSTQKLGTGVNIQDRIVAMHHPEFPWRPSDFDQRNGRGARSKNWAANKHRDNTVNNYIYATRRTLDPYQFNLLSNKQQFIMQLKTASTAYRRIDEGAIADDGTMNFAEYVALLSGNTDLLEKVRLEKQVSSLESSYSVFLQSQANNKASLHTKTNNLPMYKRTLDNLTNDKRYYDHFHVSKREALSKVEKKFTYPNAVSLEGKHYTDPTELGKALLAKEREIISSGALPSTSKPVATYGEFELHAAGIVDYADGLALSFFVTRGTIKYKHSNDTLNHGNPNSAGRYIANCLDKISNLVESQTSKVQRTEQDIKSLSENKAGVFQELDKLHDFKRRIKDLDKRIASSSKQSPKQHKTKF
jgi:N12 class adenine-specific DNA methylase